MSPSLTTSLNSRQTLNGTKVAVMISDGFEQSEFEESVKALRAAGVHVEVLAQTEAQMTKGIQAFEHLTPTITVKADKLVVEARPDEYEGLLIPGGALSVDRMRESMSHLGFVQNFMDSGKPIAVICHGGWLLADSGAAQGITLTSWPAIRKDLERAGAIWKDAEVIQDRNVITSRKPTDLPAFIQTMISALQKRTRERSTVAA